VAPLLENLEEDSSARDFESWMKEPWGWGIALSTDSMNGASGRAPLPGNPKDEWRAPEREHLFLWELRWGLPSGDPEGHREEGSDDGYVRSPGTLIDS